MLPVRAPLRAPRAPRLAPRRSSVPKPAPVDALEPRTLMATFVVTTVEDGGPGSLREAIELANLGPAFDEIRFNILGDGLYRTIAPASPLPAIVSQLTIDATTQPGYAQSGLVASPVVELNGAGAGPAANGLTISFPGFVVRGLAINRFGGHGVAITGPPVGAPGPVGTGARIERNYIGTDVTGNFDRGNGGAGVMVATSGVIIGAQPVLTGPSARNVISGNGFAGVWIVGTTQPLSGIVLSGNYIGTNAAGNRALGNDRDGVLIDGNFVSVTVGGPMTSTGSAFLPRNVISGNAGSGIRAVRQTVGSLGLLVVEGNYVGTDASGANALGNGRSAALPFRDGITFAGGTLRIGGPTVASRNFISANGGSGVAVSGGDAQIVGNWIGTDRAGNADLGNRLDGVVVSGAQAGTRITGNVVSGNGRNGVRLAGVGRPSQVGGNYVGVNATGTSALGNDDDGIELDEAAVVVTVGGTAFSSFPSTTPQPLSPFSTGRNVVSANGGNGIMISSNAATTRPHNVIANYIGTDYTAAVPLGNSGSGVYIAARGVVIGGPGTNRNIIGGNGGNGITLLGPIDAQQRVSTLGNRIEGNLIGAGLDNRGGINASPVDTGLGNHGNGIAILYSSGNRVGTGFPGAGNTIAFNGESGVLVEGLGGTVSPFQLLNPAAADGNLISGNAIHGNGKLGIDLASPGEGVTPNDLRDTDAGPNRLQNHPIITEAAAPAFGTTVSVRFTLHSAPNTTYRVEFFASAAPDPSGRGEGQSYLGFTTVTTDAGGNVNGTFVGTSLVPQRPGTGTPPLFITATATGPASAPGGNTSEFSPAVRAGATLTPPGPFPQGSSTVVGRHVFYENSAFDQAGGDDAAIAPDKRALRPGETPSFANVTSYSRGLNGVMVDVAGLPAGVVVTPDEFEARVADTAGGAFRNTAKPYAVSLRRGAGVNGSDRITLYWSDNLPRSNGVAPAVLNGWLEVKVLASAVTGLAATDVFYFGNLVGETGNPSAAGTGAFRIDGIDLALTRAVAPSAGTSLTSRFDHDRDGDVDASDIAGARAYYGQRLDVFSTEPIVAPAGAAIRARPPVRERWADGVLA